MAESATAAPTAASAPAAAGSCCSAFYEQDWVRLLAEDSFHPGGAELTRRTVAAMTLPPSATLLDLGCGTGTTAALVAAEFGLAVTGVDLSAANVTRAGTRAPGCHFVQGDVQALPLADASFDGALAECVFSLMPDKAQALREIRRVLVPGGRLGLTDMAIDGSLPEDLAQVVAPWTCLADASDPAAYRALFEDAGFSVDAMADESAGLLDLIGQIKRRLLLVGAGVLLDEGERPPALDLATLKRWLNRFRDEVKAGTVRYVRFALRAPQR